MNIKYEIYIKRNIKTIRLELPDTTIYMLGITGLNPDEPEAEQEMPKDRYDKMKRYLNLSDRARHLGNELLFYHGIKDICGREDVMEDKSVITRMVDGNGKPYIADCQDLYYNMSHSGDYAVCAFSDHPLGVDIEGIRAVHLDIAKRFFCPEEYEQLMQLPSAEQANMFYRYWVLKESFIKAVGLGLQIPLNQFSFEKIVPQIGVGNSIGSKSDGKILELLRVKHRINNKEYIARLIDCGSIEYKLAVCQEAIGN